MTSELRQKECGVIASAIGADWEKSLLQFGCTPDQVATVKASFLLCGGEVCNCGGRCLTRLLRRCTRLVPFPHVALFLSRTLVSLAVIGREDVQELVQDAIN